MRPLHLLLVLTTLALPAFAQKAKEKKPERPTPPTRAFDAPGAPKFIRLDGKPGVNPPVDAEGDFVIGPDYVAAPETKVVEGVPQGKVQQFTMESKDCKLF
ncbi:MAG TPA: esterase family protein, partial [Prosthecobacter sp.]|nr:esterase family protein [Prosthecobacter sp.]